MKSRMFASLMQGVSILDCLMNCLANTLSLRITSRCMSQYSILVRGRSACSLSGRDVHIAVPQMADYGVNKRVRQAKAYCRGQICTSQGVMKCFVNTGLELPKSTGISPETERFDS